MTDRDRPLRVHCQAFAHKAEVAHIEGRQWWSKACRSNWEATAIVGPVLPVRRQKRVYCYLGGGSLSEGSTEDSGCLVARCKSWDAVAAAVVAIAIMTAAVPGPTVRLRRRFVTAAEADPAGEQNLYEVEEDADANAAGTADEAGGDVGQALVDHCDRAIAQTAAALNIPAGMLINDGQTEADAAGRNYMQLREVLSRRVELPQ